MPVPSSAGKLERLLWRAQARAGVTGKGYGKKQFEDAMMTDSLQGANPWMTTAGARMRLGEKSNLELFEWV